MKRKTRVSNIVVGLSVGLAMAAWIQPTESARAAALMFECSNGVCVDNGKWEPDQVSTSKDRQKRRKNAAKLDLTISSGRGSAFVNGRYVGTAPLSGVKIASGPNDIEIRNGSEVLARGLLWVKPDETASMTLE